ncbi:MAG: hypothetical protein V3U24_00195 [Candidatus Neomarinimicrobiota bacterium]
MGDVDLFTNLAHGRGTFLFLGQYSGRGILSALDKLGILAQLRQRGLYNISVEVDTSRPFQHLLRFFHTETGEEHLICEVVVRRAFFSLPEGIRLGKSTKPYDILIVEWLLLQNPLGKFTKDRPQLPGQEFPGLGLSSETFEILYWISRRLKTDGVLIVPNYLHSAIMYSREFLFVDPHGEAMLKKIKRGLLKTTDLTQVTWACHEEKILEQGKNRYLKWQPSEMILPVSKTMNDYFYSMYYRSQISMHMSDFDFSVEKGYEKRFTSQWLAAS